MLLNAVVLADSVRAVIPCSFLSASMVPFATISLGIGGLSWVVPKRVFITLDNTLYRAYMRLCLFVFENVSAVQLKLYGDADLLRSSKKSTLVLANHQSNVDWAVLLMLAARQGTDGHESGFRVMVKQAIHMVPLFGWYIFQHGYIYVRRFGGFESGPVLKQLTWLNDLGESYWLMMFPEGTRYSQKNKKTIEASQNFCNKSGLPILQNVLCPRTGGASLALDHLNVDHILDVTIGYGQTRNEGRRGRAPGMFEFCCGPLINRTLNIHVKEYSVKDIPKDKDGRREWMMKIFTEKDSLMEQFYNTGEFPDLRTSNESAISIWRTLPATLFFSAALGAPFFSSTIRQAYVYTIASSPLLLLWLRIRKCV